MKPAIDGLNHSVKKHVLDSNMVVKVFDVSQARECAAGMQMNRRRCMCRHRQVCRVTQRADSEKFADASATRRVRLLNVHRTGVNHALEVRQSYPYSPAAMSIPAGTRSRISRRPSRSSDVTGSSNQLTSNSVNFSAMRALVCANTRHWHPRYNSTSGPIASRAALPEHVVCRVAANLHLYGFDSFSAHPANCFRQLFFGVRSESAASVDFDARLAAPCSRAPTAGSEVCLSDPTERNVDRSDGHRTDSGTPQVANRVPHCRPASGDVHGIASAHDRNQRMGY